MKPAPESGDKLTRFGSVQLAMPRPEVLDILVQCRRDSLAHIDANPEIDTLVRRYRRIPLGYLSLYLSGTVQRIHYAAELEEQSIVCRLNDPTAMFLDFGVCHLSA